MLSWSFSEEAAAEKYMPQLQHNMSSQNPLRAGVLRRQEDQAEERIRRDYAVAGSWF